MSADDFRRYIRLFATTKDPQEHHDVIMEILNPLDLEIEYLKLKSEGGLAKVEEVFRSFAEVPHDEMIGELERSSLKQVGQLTGEYFTAKNFKAFAQMAFVITLESMLEFYDLLEDVQVNDKHIAHLYKHIADEIYVQMFILEHMAHEDHFDWNRDIQILEQSLIALTVCFSDIYGFLSEREEEEEPTYVD